MLPSTAFALALTRIASFESIRAVRNSVPPPPLQFACSQVMPTNLVNFVGMHALAYPTLMLTRVFTTTTSAP